jgi:hypothetical protein
MAATPAALTHAISTRKEKWQFKQFTLKAGETAFKGGLAVIKQSDAKCYAGVSGTGYVAIGEFAETIDNSASAVDVLVNVELFEEVTIKWFRNATSSDDVAATDFGKVCYFFDDHSVTITSTSRSIAGLVWGVDSAKGVAVQVGKGVVAAAA